MHVLLSLFLDEPSMLCNTENIPTLILTFILVYVTIGIVIYGVVLLTLNDRSEEKTDNFDMESINEKVSQKLKI